ncbi:dimethylnonatriene synthase-like [Tripterygium wilfordii]|uniref:dimethylnonatriene synthase-like n=1 Tax=Tripterygium wilfordii TaxID=458696 RepID=UPI0018F84286|nr:dimethylnonatriene synthase-like [Tripterygium wilfordii]
MEFALEIQTLVWALALLLLYSLKRSIVDNNKKNKVVKKVPEPSGAWPIIGHLHLLGGQDPICRILGAMADKLGPIYSLRLGNYRALVVSNWEIARDCFTTNDRILATRPSIAVGKYIGYNNAIFALAPYGDYWRDIRKLATLQLLSSSRLETLYHVRSSEIDAFIKDLYIRSKDNQTHVSIDHLIEHMTFNINLRMLTGKRFNGEVYDDKNSEASRFKKALNQALFLSGVFVVSDFVPSLEWMDFGGYVSSMKSTAKEIDSVLGNWLQERLQRRKEDKEASSDFMDVMLSTLEDGEIMSGHTRDTVVKATVLILMMTGTESTAVTLTWALSLLLNNPTVLKKAQEELDINVGRQNWVQESDIKNLKYLQAIVKETLRLYPPGPITGPREATEDCYIGGYHVPKGTRLIVDIWKLQRDPNVWSNPTAFEPERFMTTHAGIDVRGSNFEYMPFSSGRRSCPGVTFGLQVVQLTLARLIQGFDLRTAVAGAEVDMREGLGIALPKVEPVEVVLEPRLGPGLYK